MGIGPRHAGTGCGDLRSQEARPGAPFDFTFRFVAGSGARTVGCRKTAAPSTALRSGLAAHHDLLKVLPSSIHTSCFGGYNCPPRERQI